VTTEKPSPPGHSEAPKDRRYDAYVWALATGASKADAAVAAGIHRTTAYRWSSRAGFEEVVEEAAAASIETLRKRAFELAMSGNIRILIWLLQNRGEISAAEAGWEPSRAGQEVGVVEVEIVGLASGGDMHENDGGPAARRTGARAFIEFVDEDDE